MSNSENIDQNNSNNSTLPPPSSPCFRDDVVLVGSRVTLRQPTAEDDSDMRAILSGSHYSTHDTIYIIKHIVCITCHYQPVCILLVQSTDPLTMSHLDFLVPEGGWTPDHMVQRRQKDSQRIIQQTGIALHAVDNTNSLVGMLSLYVKGRERNRGK